MCSQIYYKCVLQMIKYCSSNLRDHDRQDSERLIDWRWITKTLLNKTPNFSWRVQGDFKKSVKIVTFLRKEYKGCPSKSGCFGPQDVLWVKCCKAWEHVGMTFNIIYVPHSRPFENLVVWQETENQVRTNQYTWKLHPTSWEDEKGGRR